MAAGMRDVGLCVTLVIRALGQHVWAMLMPAPGHGLQGLDVTRQQIFCIAALKTVGELFGRGRDASYLTPPAQIRTCRTTAYGSCQRS